MSQPDSLLTLGPTDGSQGQAANHPATATATTTTTTAAVATTPTAAAIGAMTRCH